MEWVIANGAEREPLLYNDQELLRVAWQEVLSGLPMVGQATAAKRLVLAVKKKNQELVSLLRGSITAAGVEIAELPDCYPAGDEHEVPAGGLPVDVGVLVQNVETLHNVATASRGLLVTERTITLGGGVQEPRVLRVPVGTLVHDLLQLCGGAQCQAPAFLLVGMMMGTLTMEPATPVEKITSAVVVLPANHPCVQRRMQSLQHQLRNAQSACTQCVLCTESCNRYLLGHQLQPHRLMRTMALGLRGDNEIARIALLCWECRACEYACPMGLSPRLVNRQLKRLVRRPVTEVAGGGAPVPRVPLGTGRIPTDRLVAPFALGPYQRRARYWEHKVAPKRVVIRLKQHAGARRDPRSRAARRSLWERWSATVRQVI